MTQNHIQFQIKRCADIETEELRTNCATAANSSLAKWRVQCYIEHLVFKLTLVLK